MENSKQPIVPVTWRQKSETRLDPATPKELNEGAYLSYTTGLTKREYFAAMAMQGILANNVMGRHYKSNEIAESSLAVADELLKQLEK